MRAKAIFKAMSVMLVLVVLVCGPSVYLQAKAAEDEGVFNFHYEQLNPLQKEIFEQLDFCVYEEDPANGYAVFEAESEKVTATEMTEAVLAYFYDNALLACCYDAKNLAIYDMSAYYQNTFLVKAPIAVYAEEEQEVLVSYLNFMYQVAEYYAEDDVYTGIKLLLMTVCELAKVTSVDTVCLLEAGVEAMGIPCVTAYAQTGEAVLTYVLLGEWYAINWKHLEIDEDTGEVRHFLLSRAEITDSVTGDLAYLYPNLADSRYVHTVVEVEYSLEQREVRTGETEEVVPFYHLYLYGSMENPSPYYNVPDSRTGAIIPASSVMEFYVPLLDFPDYTVVQVKPYHEVINAITGYSGALILRTQSEWYHEVYLQNLAAFFHKDGQIVYAYKYTRIVQE